MHLHTWNTTETFGQVQKSVFLSVYSGFSSERITATDSGQMNFLYTVVTWGILFYYYFFTYRGVFINRSETERPRAPPSVPQIMNCTEARARAQEEREKIF